MTVIFYIFVFLSAGVYSLNEQCSVNTDCTTKNAICRKQLCDCDQLSYFNNTECLEYATEYKAYCKESEQCAKWLGPYSECRNHRCVCVEKYRWYKGTCQKYSGKGESCESDVECYDGNDLLSMKCNTGKCVCASGFYDRGPDCRHQPPTFDTTCALHQDCAQKLFNKKYCQRGECTTPPSSVIEMETVSHSSSARKIFNTISAAAGNCESDDDCKNKANSVCHLETATCQCLEGYYLYEGNCLRGFERCNDTDDCKTTNTVCFKDSCICKQGYFLQDAKCIPELGVADESYTKDSDCLIKPSKRVQSTCYCRNYWFNDDANRNCIKTTTQDLMTCLTNEWCGLMGPYAFCNSTIRKCQCSSFAELNQETYYCELTNNRNAICLSDNDCDINERCLDEKCQCLENFSRDSTKQCVPDIGGSCSYSSCHTENSKCRQRVCQCENNYALGSSNRCLKVLTNMEEPCEEDIQCQNIPFTSCAVKEADSVTNYCTCTEGFTAINVSTCLAKKSYGDPCMKNFECSLTLGSSFTCRGNKCQCGTGLRVVDGYCVSSTASLVISRLILVLGAIVWLFN